MDEDKILLLRILIGDTPNSPLYPLFTDEEIQVMLDFHRGNVVKAARMAAISASMTLAGYSNYESTGDISVRNTIASEYRQSLRDFLSDTVSSVPVGLFPWTAVLSKQEICAFAQNPNLIKSSLIGIKVCGERPEIGGCC